MIRTSRNADGRLLEIFLDRMAWRAAEVRDGRLGSLGRSLATWPMLRSPRRSSSTISALRLRSERATLTASSSPWVSILDILSGAVPLMLDVRQPEEAQRPRRTPASMLKEALGEAFEDVLVEALGAERYAVSHGLRTRSRSERCSRRISTRLYEKAAEMPLEGQLSVLPWGRVPGRPPWLLKMHGDVENGDTGPRKEDCAAPRPVGYLVVQCRCASRVTVFVGYSLRDSDFIELANEGRSDPGPERGSTQAMSGRC